MWSYTQINCMHKTDSEAAEWSPLKRNTICLFPSSVDNSSCKGGIIHGSWRVLQTVLSVSLHPFSVDYRLTSVELYVVLRNQLTDDVDARIHGMKFSRKWKSFRKGLVWLPLNKLPAAGNISLTFCSMLKNILSSYYHTFVPKLWQEINSTFSKNVPSGRINQDLNPELGACLLIKFVLHTRWKQCMWNERWKCKIEILYVFGFVRTLVCVCVCVCMYVNRHPNR